MQHLPADRRVGCISHDHPRLGRRDLLQVGGMSLVGMGLSDLLRLEAQAAEASQRRQGTAKSVVFIFQSGGPSQHETFDPKPKAPDSIRGAYGKYFSAIHPKIISPTTPEPCVESLRPPTASESFD